MATTSNATWIWYPGDFEVWLGNIVNNRRTERGAMFPPFWKQDSHWPTVAFTKTAVLAEETTVGVRAEGQYSFSVDGRLLPQRASYTLPRGEHVLSVKVWNQATPPALFVDGGELATNGTWLVTYEDKIWIDERGVAHGSGHYVPAASWCFDSADSPPSGFRLPCSEWRPTASETLCGGGTLYDFGRETFGYLKLRNLRGIVNIYYGESREEALDKEHCETLDHSPFTSHHDAGSPSAARLQTSNIKLQASKAFRYVFIEKEAGADYDEVLMDYEYAPHAPERSGAFRCSDDELNRIWDVAAYTLDLTTREFFLDGIKRDRWTWSGDAIQSYLMNYYLRFDNECVKRTIRQLRGKDPVTAHVNTIMDYTFYWFKSIYDYYQYTGDEAFIVEMWPRMVTLMDYVLSRTNADGMAEGQADDWIFVDWVDFPMHKRGVLCFEQILLAKALETMAVCADIAGRAKPAADHGNAGGRRGADAYAALADALRSSIRATFWSEDAHAYLHALEEGHLNAQVTKFPNMFAILYGLASDQEQRDIMDGVMLNPAVHAITTPYMRFYELETLCMTGHQTEVLSEIKDYWGGMLRCGATTFWEKYNPTESGTQHLAMYGRPYGKSLCHAWGASPLYLLGRYFLGVTPTEPGYAAYRVAPVTGGLDWMEGNVPTPFGKIHVAVNRQSVTVRSDGGRGTLIVGSRQVDIPAGSEVCVTIDAGV